MKSFIITGIEDVPSEELPDVIKGAMGRFLRENGFMPEMVHVGTRQLKMLENHAGVLMDHSAPLARIFDTKLIVNSLEKDFLMVSSSRDFKCDLFNKPPYDAFGESENG